MKKRTIAIAFTLMSLIIVYLIISWLNGLLIAAYFDNKINKINEFIDNHQKLVKVKITYNDYQTNIFSTNVKITAIIESLSSKNQNLTKAKQSVFRSKVTIHHGPFPWSELRQFNFLPKLASIHYQISQGSPAKSWNSKNFTPCLSSNISIDYKRNITFRLVSLPINKISLTEIAGYKASNGRFSFYANHDFSEFNMEADLDHFKMKDHKLKIDFSKLKIIATSLPSANKNNLKYKLLGSLSKANISGVESGKKKMIHLTNIIYSTVLNNNFERGFTNVNQLSIDKIYLDDKHKKINIDDIKIVNKNRSVNNSTVHGFVNYRVGTLSVDNQNFGYGQAKISYKNLPVSSLNFLANYFSEKRNSPLKDHDIRLNLDKLDWRNAFGDIEMKLSAQLNDLRFDDKLNLANLNKDNISKLDFSLRVPFKALAYFFAQVLNLDTDHITNEYVNNIYQSTITISSELLKNSPFLQVIPSQRINKKELGIYSELHYDVSEKNAMINGESIPKSDFFKRLKLLN